MTRAVQPVQPPARRAAATDGIVLTLAEGVHARREYFGALAWQLGVSGVADVRGMHADVLMAAAEGMAVSLAADDELRGVVDDLQDQGLVTISSWPHSINEEGTSRPRASDRSTTSGHTD